MLRICLDDTLTLSDLRIALFSYLYAQTTHDQLIVRLVGESETVLDILALCGISYQFFYRQRDNFKYHLQFASTLLDRKKAFICFCPEDKSSPYDGACEHLDSETILNNPNPFVIRMKPSKALDESFIMMDTHKYPTPLFARACDDMLQGVTCVLQEEASQNDAPKEAWVREALGYDQTINYLPLAPFQGGDVAIKSLLDEGFMPEAIVNYLLVSGSETPQSIFTCKEALSWFKPDILFSTAVQFDKESLRFFNTKHKHLS